MIFQKQRKSVSVRDPCAVNDLSAISPSAWTNLASLKDCWEIIGRSMRSLSAPWAFVEHSLSICWEIASLGDHWEIVLDLVKPLRRRWQPWRSLDNHWQIIKRSGRLLGALWNIIERSGDFVHHSTISQRSPPLRKGGLSIIKWCWRTRQCCWGSWQSHYVPGWVTSPGGLWGKEQLVVGVLHPCNI